MKEESKTKKILKQAATDTAVSGGLSGVLTGLMSAAETPKVRASYDMAKTIQGIEKMMDKGRTQKVPTHLGVVDSEGIRPFVKTTKTPTRELPKNLKTFLLKNPRLGKGLLHGGIAGLATGAIMLPVSLAANTYHAYNEE